MLIDFFLHLKQHALPVSVRELLDLLRALDQHQVFADRERFYYLARTVLIKDEKYFDKFDRAFTQYFDGVDALVGDVFTQHLTDEIPGEWLRKQIENMLSPEERQKINALGDLDKLMEEFQKRLQEQKERHQGGNRWVGTGGTSPFGAYGYNPAGFRMAGASVHKRAVKVWEQRQYANLDADVSLGTRNIQVALRRLRKMARTGVADQLDLPNTIRETAKQGGLLDIQLVAERRNQIKVLLFFDVGGSMDPYIHHCETLFSAARSEFKYLEYFYFHNCVYESVWRDNQRRKNERISTWDILRTYGRDYRVIFVGDAAMSPYEVSAVGGSVEHWNAEAGEVWLRRLTSHFDRVVWLNPEEASRWEYTTSTAWIRTLLENRMFPLTLQGLEEAIRCLTV